ncbi:MAG: hypothetical protein QGF90_15200, partial [Gammaproteobacteria bacterium]|nr:hypothetical protein [Gammaproteobacteria bacterium]
MHESAAQGLLKGLRVEPAVRVSPLKMPVEMKADPGKDNRECSDSGPEDDCGPFSARLKDRRKGRTHRDGIRHHESEV